jgi:TldD protein
MRDLVSRALDTASQQGAAYADTRVVERRAESITVRNQNVEGLAADESLGFGVRVIVDGYWGFAGSYRMTPEEADRVAAKAVAIARASARAGGPQADIGPPEVRVDAYRTPFRTDPFAVSLDDKITLLLRVNEAMMKVKSIVMAQSNVYYQREKKTFGSSEGGFIEQDLVETGCGVEATAVDEGEVQQRSYPNSVGRVTPRASPKRRRRCLPRRPVPSA